MLLVLRVKQLEAARVLQAGRRRRPRRGGCEPFVRDARRYACRRDLAPVLQRAVLATRANDDAAGMAWAARAAGGAGGGGPSTEVSVFSAVVRHRPLSPCAAGCPPTHLASSTPRSSATSSVVPWNLAMRPSTRGKRASRRSASRSCFGCVKQNTVNCIVAAVQSRGGGRAHIAGGVHDIGGAHRVFRFGARRQQRRARWRRRWPLFVLAGSLVLPPMPSGGAAAEGGGGLGRFLLGPEAAEQPAGHPQAVLLAAALVEVCCVRWGSIVVVELGEKRWLHQGTACACADRGPEQHSTVCGPEAGPVL